jgi:hypothetical protein
MANDRDFTDKGRRIEILPPDAERMLARFWTIRIDGNLCDILFNSGSAAERGAMELIGKEGPPQ